MVERFLGELGEFGLAFVLAGLVLTLITGLLKHERDLVICVAVMLPFTIVATIGFVNIGKPYMATTCACIYLTNFFSALRWLGVIQVNEAEAKRLWEQWRPRRATR